MISSLFVVAARRRAEQEKLKKPFQHVYITCPDGQHVQYLNDECYQSKDDAGGVVVRQSYPVRPLGSVREKPASEETSRTVMTDGTVIKVRRGFESSGKLRHGYLQYLTGICFEGKLCLA